MRLVSLMLGAVLAGLLALPAGAESAAPPPLPAQAPAPVQAPAAAPLTVTPLNSDMISRRMARRAARVDQDIQTLRAGLQLTPAQDALWPPVADAIHAVDTARGFRFRQTMANAASQVDGLKLQGDHMAAMGAAIGKLADATKPLVATLTADQKSRLPGLLQDVRLPKVMSRALDLPQDTGGSSEAGQQGPNQQGRGQGQQQGGQGQLGQGQLGQGGAGQDRSWGIGSQGGAAAGAPAASPRAGAAGGPTDADEE